MVIDFTPFDIMKSDFLNQQVKAISQLSKSHSKSKVSNNKHRYYINKHKIRGGLKPKNKRKVSGNIRKCSQHHKT